MKSIYLYLHNKARSHSVVAVATGERAARDEAVVGLAGSVHSDEGSTTGEGAEDGLEGDVVESREEVSTAHAVMLGLCALQGIHHGVLACLIRVVGLVVAVHVGDADEGTIIVELEEVALTEAVNDCDHGQLVTLKVESLHDGIVGDLEREGIEATIGDDLNVLKATFGVARGGAG